MSMLKEIHDLQHQKYRLRSLVDRLVDTYPAATLRDLMRPLGEINGAAIELVAPNQLPV